MATTLEHVEREPVTVTEQEADLIKVVERFLRTKKPRSAQLVASNGEKLEVPEPIFKVLLEIIPLMAQGHSIGLVPLHRELSTQQAADLLNVSRPFLVKLLDQGVIPHTRTGTHRRVQFKDVMEYKRCRSAERKEALDALTALGEKYGEYD